MDVVALAWIGLEHGSMEDGFVARLAGVILHTIVGSFFRSSSSLLDVRSWGSNEDLDGCESLGSFELAVALVVFGTRCAYLSLVDEVMHLGIVETDRIRTRIVDGETKVFETGGCHLEFGILVVCVFGVEGNTIPLPPTPVILYGKVPTN